MVLVDDVADGGGAEMGVVEILGQLTDEVLTGGGLIACQAVAGVERLNAEPRTSANNYRDSGAGCWASRTSRSSVPG